MSGAGRSPPDFTEIDGVGPDTADALVAAKVASMAALAAMSVDEVVEAVRAAGGRASVKTVIDKRWLEQAWSLSRTPTEDQAAHDEEPDDRPTGNGWEEFGGFFVYFDHQGEPGGAEWRTRVWDTSTLTETVLPGVAPEPWISLVLGRAGLPDEANIPTDTAFEVVDAGVEERRSTTGTPETWISARLAVRVDPSSFVAALGAAVWSAALTAEPATG